MKSRSCDIYLVAGGRDGMLGCIRARINTSKDRFAYLYNVVMSAIDFLFHLSVIVDLLGCQCNKAGYY